MLQFIKKFKIFRKNRRPSEFFRLRNTPEYYILMNIKKRLELGPGPEPLKKATGTGTTEKKLTGPGPKNLGPAHH
jgi:hypothetical protein